MAFDFPASPTNGQVYTSGGKSYAWNGVAWDPQGSTYVAKSGDTMSGQLGIGAPIPTENWLHVRKGSAGTPPAWTASDVALFENTTGSNVVLQFLTSNAAVSAINFSDTDARGRGAFTYAHATDMLSVTAGGVNVLNATATSLGTPLTTASTSPTTGALTVAGGVGVGGALNLAASQLISFGGQGSMYGNASTIFQQSNSHAFNSAGGVTAYMSIDATKVDIKQTTTSTSPTTGALTVAGGVGVAGAARVGGTLAGQADFNMAGAIDGWCFYQAAALGGVFQTSATSDVNWYARRRGTDGTLASFYKNTGQVGAINVTTTATAYVTSSDERLKEDLQSFDAGRIIDQTEVYDFRWKETGARSYGIAAQQAVEVYAEPIFHDEEKDWWGVDYSKYVPVLLQELKALRARVAQLEGRPAVDPKEKH